MPEHYRKFYWLGLALLVGSVMMIMVSLGGIAAGVSGSGASQSTEDMLVLSVYVFWGSWGVLLMAVVLHLKQRANRSALNDQSGSDETDSR
ncbi:hypothetical protein SAMN03080615_04138 [Amphritea atlantica]|uniref:Uncharacterized protein n=1 Tax=Amphritea atlantica TaxID=355243 RepID=A0A1H9LWZ8_9GAMM|nr:hypothetical protein [Amphritea atlantica]SER15976.1 hypothetical protein SAMN03080615_04138 [Amphritea atlantica]